MRHHTDRPRRARRNASAGVSVAVAGSIALTLSAVPAQAAERTERDAPLRALPGLDRMAGLAKTPVAASAQVRTAATSTPATYTVKAGDTVSAIAARFGLRTADVLALNKLSWSSIIYPGQVLKLKGTASAPAPAKPSTSAASGSHTVKGGETVSAIARKYGLATTTVLKANKLGWSSIIYPGQKLVIPGAAVPAASVTPAAPSTPAAKPASSSYTVRSGDTVSGIAQRHGVTTAAVLSANKLGWSSIIYPGQKLTIPKKASSSSSSSSSSTVAGLDAEQTANAKLIISVGRQMGVPDRGIAIALGTAMQESWLRNLDWGDRDSLGLFQQRPSTGWGTAAQVQDPVRATKVFFGGPSDPNGSRTRGLLDIPGWQSMSFAQAAQAVQISAYPDRYARWEKPAYQWLAALG